MPWLRAVRASRSVSWRLSFPTRPLVQRELVTVVAEFRRHEEPACGDPNRVQSALDAGFPEMEEFVEHRKSRCEIEFLPYEGLQDRRVIGEVVQNFGRREPVAVQTQLEPGHWPLLC